MKNNLTFLSLSLVFLLIILHSCKKEELPTLSTSSITNITATSATSGGNITSDGNASVTLRGVCWSVNTNPTTSDSKTSDGTGTGQFVSSITDLVAGSSYHIRAYATNSVGTAYGADLSFATLGKAPECLSQAATNITSSGATLNGTVNANYLSTTVTFEYGTTTSYGQIVPSAQYPITGNSITNVSADISNLIPGTTYHFRVIGTNSLGTTNGNDMSFTTLGQVPTATTQAACCLSPTGAKLNGIVNANYVSTTVTFEYGLTTAYGSSVTATPNPVTGNNAISVSASISGLNSGATYHFRIKAVNSLGTTYGSDMTFTTLAASGTVTDIDGNTYDTITIGSQVWMAENLKTTKYCNGDLIGTTIPASLNISGETSPKYQWAYLGDESNVATYGRLYTWDAVTDSRKVCPTDWHLPSDAEWATLENFLIANGFNYDGTTTGNKYAKSLASVSGWTASSNAGAVGNTDYPGKRNSTCFTALPGGYRIYIGSFFYVGRYGSWWSATEDGATYAWYRNLLDISSEVYRLSDNKKYGFSVRCIKD